MVQPGLERVEINYYTVDIGALVSGYVDHITPEQYGVTSALPSTNVLSYQKEAENMRWEEIIRQVSDNIQPLRTTGVLVTGADEDTPGTAMTFTLSYDRVEYLRTEDEENLGTYLTGADAIKRWVERALIVERTENRFVYKPDFAPTTTVRSGPAIESITSVAAEATLPIASVTVTAVADVTVSI